MFFSVLYLFQKIIVFVPHIGSTCQVHLVKFSISILRTFLEQFFLLYISLKIISGQLLGVPLDVRRGDASLLSQVVHHHHHHLYHRYHHYNCRCHHHLSQVVHHHHHLLLVNQLRVEDMFIFSQRAGPVPPGEKGQEEKQSGEGT